MVPGPHPPLPDIATGRSWAKSGPTAARVNRAREYARDVRAQYVSYSPPKCVRSRALIRAYAREERRDDQRRQQHADARAKDKGPPQRVDEQPQIARVADSTIDTSGDQRMPGLERMSRRGPRRQGGANVNARPAAWQGPSIPLGAAVLGRLDVHLLPQPVDPAERPVRRERMPGAEGHRLAVLHHVLSLPGPAARGW